MTRHLNCDPFADMTIPDLLSMLMGGEPCKRAGPGSPVASPTRVYRVEMPNGNGPFNSGLPNHEEIYDKICCGGPGWDCARLAGPEGNNEQMGLTEAAFREAHGCVSYGCESLRAIGNWFPAPARGYLKTLGAKIVEYELAVGQPLEVVGHGEVLFDKTKARRLGSNPVDMVIR